MSQPRIYLDHAATTPLVPAAREAVGQGFERWHNPSSPHAEGRAAKAELERARTRIAANLGWTGKILFTSGATEALAMAIQRFTGRRIFISPAEHDAALRAAAGAELLEVDENGIVRLEDAEAGALYVIQHANNETGVIQPIAALAETIRAAGGTLLCDCAQTAGKLPLPDADMITISAHKFGGPPGIGALLIRDLVLIHATGGQEQGYRGGTEPLPLILGMAAALEAGDAWLDRAAALRARFEQRILAAGGDVVAGSAERIPAIGAYRMPGIAANTQLIRFDMAGIAISAGSACASGSLKPSRTLLAMGLPEAAAGEVVRISFGPLTSEAEVDRAADLWSAIAAEKRAA